jgi:phosphonate transport system substrate-binding protein
MKKRFQSALLNLLLIPALSLSFYVVPAASDAAEISRNKTLVIGAISENPQKRFAKVEKLAAYLLGHLAGLGYENIDVRFAKDVDSMAGKLRDGTVDALSETAFSAVRLIDDGGAEPLLREWKSGVASYHTVFFTATDGGINTLADLKGKRIAFEDPGSTSAFLIHLAMLLEAGLEAAELDNIAQPPPADKVGYAFPHDEPTQLAWGTRRFAAAGAFSNLNWNSYQDNKAVRESLRVVHAGEPVMRSVFLVRGGLPDAVKARIADTLLAMPDDEAGRGILLVYNKVKKYDRLIQA